jgi:hypothetical protein
MDNILLVPWLKTRRMPVTYLKRLKVTGLLLAGKNTKNNCLRSMDMNIYGK